MTSATELPHFFFANDLIMWYQSVKRDLPWRNTRDPYAIWLSEVILQQTRVAQGLPYFERFIHAFPTVQALAEAKEEEVLRLWQGLGYYSRARNLHKTAKVVATTYHGVFPTTYEALLKLPGIGPYTAAAIASFAFREAVPVVDGNVFRVLARIFGEYTDIQSSAARPRFSALARSLMPPDHPDEFNQAIMEFGALQCTPQSPRCSDCPAVGICYAHQHQVQTELPVKTKKTAVRNRYFQYWIWECGEKFALQARTEKDIWQHLWEFPHVETDNLVHDPQLPDGFSQPDQLSLYHEQTHLLSHQKLHLQFWVAQSKIVPSDTVSWLSAAEIENLPKPIVLAQVWERKNREE